MMNLRDRYAQQAGRKPWTSMNTIALSIAESIARCSSRATIAPLDMSSVVGGDAVDSVDLASEDSLVVLASLHSKAFVSSLRKLQRGANQALEQSSAL